MKKMFFLFAFVLGVAFSPLANAATSPVETPPAEDWIIVIDLDRGAWDVLDNGIYDCITILVILPGGDTVTENYGNCP